MGRVRERTRRRGGDFSVSTQVVSVCATVTRSHGIHRIDRRRAARARRKTRRNGNRKQQSHRESSITEDIRAARSCRSRSLVTVSASVESRERHSSPGNRLLGGLPMLERILRLSFPMLALIVGAALTFPIWTDGTVAAVRATPSPRVQAPPLFAVQCAGCHGEEGLGTAKGPALAMNQRVAEQSPDQLTAYLQRGNVAAGMPSFADLSVSDRAVLVRYLLRLNVDTITKPAPIAPTTPITWGAPQPGDWRTYNGSDSGNRYSPLEQITTANVATLKLKWVFPIQYFGLETTPLAADGVLYVTAPNQVIAIDAQTGGQLWQYSRPPSAGMVGDARLGTNRGVALLRDKIYFVTDNAHLLALDRASGKLFWEMQMAPDTTGQHFGGTIAPLIVHDTVVAGVAGADHGIRGFVAAFAVETGAVVWRTWTVPRRGEPGSETWQGTEPVTGGGSTWLTGSYDAASDPL